jgi:hypothetical protein
MNYGFVDVYWYDFWDDNFIINRRVQIEPVHFHSNFARCYRADLDIGHSHNAHWDVGNFDSTFDGLVHIDSSYSQYVWEKLQKCHK